MPQRRHTTQDSEWLPYAAEPTHQCQAAPSDHDFETVSESDGSNIAVTTPFIELNSSPPQLPFRRILGLEHGTHEAFRSYRTLAVERARVQAAMSRGPASLIPLVLEFERVQCRFEPAHLDELASYMLIILLATDSRIIEHHASGDFLTTYLNDSAFRMLIDAMTDRAGKDQPIIYRVTIADHTGHGHSDNELGRCLRLMERYVEGSIDEATSLAIDSLLDGAAATKDRIPGYGRDILESGRVSDATKDRIPGYGRYILESGRVSDACQSAMRLFIDNMRRRSTEQHGPHHRTYHSPLSYVGVTTRPQARRVEHEKGSNKTMGLFLAISMHLYGRFQIYYHPLFLCFDPAHGVAGEILFERIGLSTAATGGGFAIVPAGASNQSMRNYSDQTWEVWAEYAMHNTPFLEKLEAFSKDNKAWRINKRMFGLKERHIGLCNDLVEITQEY